MREGKTLEELSDKLNIHWKTLYRRLTRIDRKKYQEAMAGHRINCRPFGSLKARLQGADSLFELRIKELLEAHNVKFVFHAKLPEDGKYEPDFILCNRRILEASGMSDPKYWKHYRRKTRDYAKYGYGVFVVVPDCLQRTARRYLPRHNKILLVKFGEFKSQIKEYAASLR